jgi:putative nucleotidyltransferase with HDIG domain
MMPIREGQDGFIRNPGARREPDDARAHAAAAHGRLGLPLSLLVAATSVAGLVLAARGAFDTDVDAWQALIVFALLAVLAERSDLSVYGDSRVSVAFVPIFASVILGGMTGLAIVVSAAMLASAKGRPVYKTGFNFGALMVAGSASATVFDAFSIGVHSRHWLALGGISLLAGGANFAVNSVLVALAIGLSSRKSIAHVWREHFPWLTPHYLVLALLSLAMVAAYELMGIWGIAVFLAPPVMMRLSMKQYLDRTTHSVYELRQAHNRLQTAHEQLTGAMSSLNNAYDGTLRSLVAALDARDSETAGHSERVAEMTMAIAEEMGIERDTEQWREIAWGALLHDVGKIAIADAILRKPGQLTEAEWETMRTHPRSGFEILASVDFLSSAAEIVLTHHERFDGTGYPRGLPGHDIPLGARIFAIADAFDAMTSHRANRRALPSEEAHAEVLRGSGTQFDPEAVVAFLSVYQTRFVAGQLKSEASQHEPELLESVKRAIMDAAGIEKRS